ncbi:hypothetical protein BaRGS_00000845 [Batillaria attramentaria]|uniref:G-protein coupled receptors family 1 profile domain-containing protein n=1 Tax=Batillaria attramentaria TaxID=370345 RepID=A0ABD0M814_9CAEN|nr:hypothetical protein BaRGS_024328 [Batillaria attramentaria]
MADDFEETLEIETNFSSGGIFYNESLNISNCVSGYCNNLTGQGPDERYQEVERLVQIIVPTVFGVIFLLGLLGNTLVILVVVSDKNMRNTTNILILALAVADLLFIVFCVPFTAVQYAMSVWPFGSVWCKMVQYLVFVSAYLSVYTLVLMSLDRYLAVAHAIRSMSIRNERNTWLAVALTWVVIVGGHVPLLLQYDVHHYSYYGENRSACLNKKHVVDKTNGRIFYSCFLAFGYVIPLGAVCLMYGLMLKRLHGSAPGGSQSQESVRTKRRVTKMVVIIVMIFAVCWLPIQIILLLQKLDMYPMDQIPFVGLQLASNCLAYMNSCVNPFLYAFLSENFRRSFRKFLCCSSPRGRHPEYELVSVRQTENVSLLTQNKKRSITG